MSDRSRLARTARAIAFPLGLLVLLLSVAVSVTSFRDRQLAGQDHALGLTLQQQVANLENYFERARAINAVLAANPVFADFYEAPGTNQEKVDAGSPLVARVNDALAYLVRLFPGMVGEACFIDSSGAEIARVVDGVPAPPSALSHHEAENPFFAPTLALGPGKVYQAKEYESPDTHDAVISNSTVVRAAGHAGIVHYEIAIDSFRMETESGKIVASIVDADTGHVIVDSRPASSAAGDHTLGSFLHGGRDSGITTVDGRRIAFQRIVATDGNANDWFVAVSAPVVGGGWTQGLGAGPLALLLAGLLALLIGVASWWSHLRSVRRAASYDALTGLPSRALLIERLRDGLRDQRRTAVLFIDLRGFKDVNDVLGHHHGDLLLAEVAGRLERTVPAGATVARIGADDFAVLLPGIGLDEARAAGQDLLAVLHQPYPVDDISLDVEANIGVAAGPEHGADPETLLRHAETAMHEAEETATGVQSYDSAHDTNAPRRLELLGDLRRAIGTDDQISLHYQPKIDLASGRLAGVEALIRWSHPVLGRMAPDSFIPVAETTSLIRPLTDYVLREAVGQAKHWQQNGMPIPVAVNLSTRCLLDPYLADRVFSLLDRAGLPASLLELEITESMVMADPERALAVLRSLHDGGIRLSVDDFGTGHSSMTYLRILPVDELKIDRSFVQNMTDSDGDAVLVRTAITLGHNLGLSVVAEGIEDELTASALHDLGCDIAQGYHFGRPMPAADFDSWYTERSDSDTGSGLASTITSPASA
jgi:diguanylate cyclase (GGDEF)-like protein